MGPVRVASAVSFSGFHGPFQEFPKGLRNQYNRSGSNLSAKEPRWRRSGREPGTSNERPGGREALLLIAGEVNAGPSPRRAGTSL
jgi:hypothetical protein